MDNAQQQIVDSIGSASNVLVTVSGSPSVDELSAALGLTLILDKLDKRATAIFSGSIPPAITFLEPEKTFEGTADSLRDFIIALNKDKADHLRYKVDGDVVKIFITPYKTTLSQADLEFSQGDYNVELIIALGVKDQDHLDSALSAHGKILHDAKVMTITAGSETNSNLGSTDWHDDKASSLSEMIVSLVNALKSEQPLLDQQTSTALLTGIVSATDRFSNDRTSSQVMTLAAQLMAAGANQQLIAAKLQEGHDLAPIPMSNFGATDTTMSTDGTELVIDRDEKAGSTSGEKVIEPPTVIGPAIGASTSSEEADQLELEKQLAGLTGTSTGTMADIEKQLQDAKLDNEAPAAEGLPAVPADGAMPDFEPTVTPTVGDVATPTMPEEPNHTAPVGILPPDQMPAMNGTLAPEIEEPTIDPLSAPDGITAHEGTMIMPDPSTNVGTAEGASILAGLAENEAPAIPTAPDMPVMPSFEPTPAPVAMPEPEPVVAPAAEPVIPELPPLPPLPPLPTDGSVAPLPPPPPPPPVFNGQAAGAMPAGAVSGDIFGDSAAPVAPAAPAAPEPGQFKIPGQ